MLETVDLRFQYPNSDFTLEVERFAIERGEKVAIVGSSGSGKSTLLQLIAGILVPQLGTVSVLGEQVSVMTDGRRRAFRIAKLGLVFQDFELLEYLNTEENILLEYFIHSQLRLSAAVRERARSLATATGVQAYLGRPIQKLSHGERQRVAICRAMLSQPKLILADEPTANLDPSNKQQIVELLVSTAESANASLVVVTHDTEIVSHFDRTVEL